MHFGNSVVTNVLSTLKLHHLFYEYATTFDLRDLKKRLTERLVGEKIYSLQEFKDTVNLRHIMLN